MSLSSVFSVLEEYVPGLSRVMDHHMREVLQGASVAFILKVLGTALGLLFNVLLARMLGAEGAGIYFLALTVITIAAMIGRLGLDNALIRFIASQFALKNWGVVTDLYRKGVRLSTTLSLVATIIVFLTSEQIATIMFKEPLLVGPLRIMALGILPLSLLTLYGSLLTGLKKIGNAVFVQGVGIPLISIPLLIFLGAKLSINGAVLGYVIAATAVFLVSVFLWRRATPVLNGYRGTFSTRLLISTSLPLFWVVFLNYVLSSFGTIVLGIWADSVAVGIYGIAARVTLLMRFILDSVNSIIAPKFATLYEQNEIQALGNLARSVTFAMTVLAAPILLVVVLFPKAILNLFGGEFATGSTVLVVLAIGQFINVATGSVGYLLMMSGHEKIVRNNVVFNAIINVFLNLLLIPKFSIMGAAVATALSLAVKNIITVFLVRKYLAIDIYSLPFSEKK